MNPKTLCAVPFSTLIFNADGRVGTCRELGNEHVIGDITSQTLEEIWNGAPLRKLRREFLEGKISTCLYHQSTKNCHQLIENKKLLPIVEFKEQLDTKHILRLSPDFNGQCNLKCPMCTVWTLPNGLYDKINFWSVLEKNILPYLKQIDMLSGEPFIQQDTYRLIELTQKINPSLEWRFTTNAHWAWTQKIESALNQIQINFISVSLDSIVPETYKKIRTGNLQTVLHTLEKLIAYRNLRTTQERPFVLSFNFTFQRENAWELKNILDFCLSKQVQPFAQILVFPKILSIQTWPVNERRKLLDHYLYELTNEQLVYAHRVIRGLINSLPENLRSNYLQFYNHHTNHFFEKLSEASGSI